jgi:hypothetical protein
MTFGEVSTRSRVGSDAPSPVSEATHREADGGLAARVGSLRARMGGVRCVVIDGSRGPQR